MICKVTEPENHDFRDLMVTFALYKLQWGLGDIFKNFDRLYLRAQTRFLIAFFFTKMGKKSSLIGTVFRVIRATLKNT